MSWSEWYRFRETNGNPAEQCEFGVYQVRVTTGDGKPVLIRRACEDDPEGILYIGSGSLPDRVNLYLTAFRENPKRRLQFHWVYRMFHLERIGKPEFLQIRWMECGNCEKEERRLLAEYKKRTGDIPPGNLRLDGAYQPDEDGRGGPVNR